MQAAIIRDEPVDTRLLVRLTNTQTRALQALGAAKEKAQAPGAAGASALALHLRAMAEEAAAKASARRGTERAPGAEAE
jgi:hypothetical protein